MVVPVLRQRRAVADQAGLDAPGRLANLAGALEVARGRERLLRGGRVVLVDDLMTTGASLAEAARAVRARTSVSAAGGRHGHCPLRVRVRVRRGAWRCCRWKCGRAVRGRGAAGGRGGGLRSAQCRAGGGLTPGRCRGAGEGCCRGGGGSQEAGSGRGCAGHAAVVRGRGGAGYQEGDSVWTVPRQGRSVSGRGCADSTGRRSSRRGGAGPRAVGGLQLCADRTGCAAAGGAGVGRRVGAGGRGCRCSISKSVRNKPEP